MLEFCGLSDIGGRKNNEDSHDTFTIIHATGRINAFVVADGVGGVEGGEIASITAVMEFRTALIRYFEETIGEPDLRKLIRRACLKANEEVMKKRIGLHGVYSTLIAALLDDNGRGIVANVGDSRAYIIDREIRWRTKDHSLVQELVDTHQLSPDKLVKHPLKHIVTRVIGMDEVEPDLYKVDISDGGLLLMFTDGLSDTLCDDEIILWSEGDACSVCKNLIQAAKHFSADNVTIIAVKRRINI